MALATTCPKCNTSFRVAPDQLALRRGMVRCGLCQNVFSGMANLRHVDEILRQRSVEPGAAQQGPGANPAAAGAAGGGSSAGVGNPAGLQSAAGGAGAAANLSGARDAGDAPAKKPADSLGKRVSDKPGSSRRSGHGGAPSTFAQTDLRTAFFLPETVFGPTTEMVAEGQQFVSEPAAVPASIKPHLGANGGLIGGYAGTSTNERAGALNRRQTVDDTSDETRMVPPTDLADAPASIALRQPGPDTRIRWAQEAAQTQADGARAEAAKAGDDAERPRSKRRGAAQRDRSDEAIAYFAPEASVGGFASRRIALGWLFCLLGAVLLLAQLIIGARQSLTASFPSLRTPLQAIAQPFGLRIEPPLDLQALTIESFELQATDKPGQLVMSALLRNRANRGVQWPALEIVLTDGQGTLLVRKVLLPKDYFAGLPSESLRQAELGMSPRAELPLKLALDARDLAAAGYSVTLFYP